MKLDLNQMELYHGALRLMKGEYGILPVRFSGKQLDCYRDTEARMTRALCTPGVTLEVETDAKAFCLDMYVTRLSRARANVVIRSGDSRKLFEIPVSGPGNIRVKKILSGQRQKVVVYLPCLVAAELLEADLEGATFACPVAPRRSLYMAFGDSIAQGMESVDVSGIYTTRVAEALEMEQLNLGVGGAIFQPELVEENGLKPALISVCYGVNDRSRLQNGEQLMNNADHMLRRIEEVYPDARHILIISPWTCQEGKENGFTTMPEIRRIVREAAGRHPSFTVYEGMDLVPPEKRYLRDGVHPNDAGFEIWGKNMICRLSETK